jgi:hypothetical protein
MDRPPLRQGEGLVAVHLRTEKGADLIEDYTEARRGGAVFKPTHRAVTLFDPSMILLNGLITNDKFCLSRISPYRVRWARRPPQRRVFRVMTDYLHNDPEHCGGSHETPVAYPASVPGGRGGRAAMGSGLPTLAPLESAPRVPSSLSAVIDSTTAGGS